jgi:hypothetical protein
MMRGVEMTAPPVWLAPPIRLGNNFVDIATRAAEVQTQPSKLRK